MSLMQRQPWHRVYHSIYGIVIVSMRRLFARTAVLLLLPLHCRCPFITTAISLLYQLVAAISSLLLSARCCYQFVVAIISLLLSLRYCYHLVVAIISLLLPSRCCYHFVAVVALLLLSLFAAVVGFEIRWGADEKSESLLGMPYILPLKAQ
jgi:hypothetical protein